MVVYFFLFTLNLSFSGPVFLYFSIFYSFAIYMEDGKYIQRNNGVSLSGVTKFLKFETNYRTDN